MAVRPPIIDVHIDELVLEGFSRRDRLSIADSLQAELTRLIAQDGLGEWQGRSLEVERVQGGRFHAAADARGRNIGVETAKAVYGGITAARDGGEKR